MRRIQLYVYDSNLISISLNRGTLTACFEAATW
jgi:hypothetical protein